MRTKIVECGNSNDGTDYKKTGDSEKKWELNLQQTLMNEMLFPVTKSEGLNDRIDSEESRNQKAACTVPLTKIFAEVPVLK